MMTEEEKKKFAALEERLRKVEGKAEAPASPPRRDISMSQSGTAQMALDRMSLPKSAMQALVDAVPDRLVSQLRSDARRNPPTPSQPQVRQRATPNFIPERPIEPPPGIALMDRMMDVQDALDRAEVVAQVSNAARALTPEVQTPKVQTPKGTGK